MLDQQGNEDGEWGNFVRMREHLGAEGECYLMAQAEASLPWEDLAKEGFIEFPKESLRTSNKQVNLEPL